ncbi:EamA family transporter [Micromonospora zhanjiangensis]
MRVSNSLAVLLCVGGMAIVGSSVSISQLLLDYPPLTGQAVRYALAAVALFAVAVLFPGLSAPIPRPQWRYDARAAGRVARHRPVRPSGRDWLTLTLLAATGMAAFSACIMYALPHADPAVLGTVIGTAPLGFALLGPLLAGRRPAVRLLAAAVLVVAGTVLVEGGGRADRIGLVLAFGALGGEIAFTALAAAILPGWARSGSPPTAARWPCRCCWQPPYRPARWTGGACPPGPRRPPWSTWRR